MQKSARLTRAVGSTKKSRKSAPQSESAFSEAFSRKGDRDRAAQQQTATLEVEAKLKMNREKLDDEAEWRYYDRLLTIALNKYPDRELDELEAETAAKVEAKMAERRRKRLEADADARAAQRRRTVAPSPSAARGTSVASNDTELDIFRL